MAEPVRPPVDRAVFNLRQPPSNRRPVLTTAKHAAIAINNRDLLRAISARDGHFVAHAAAATPVAGSTGGRCGRLLVDVMRADQSERRTAHGSWPPPHEPATLQLGGRQNGSRRGKMADGDEGGRAGGGIWAEQG